MNTRFLKLVLIWVLPTYLFSQQIADTSYRPEIIDPAYPTEQGPVIFIDEGHHNFHTKRGRYQAFSRLLQRDGYRIREYHGRFERSKLKQGKILVISNALNEVNVTDWSLPNPSAFTSQEIQEVEDWVRSGGNLFLIADHMPMAGAAKELASVFGFSFTNGFVFDKHSRGPAHFSLRDHTLKESKITQGRNIHEGITHVVTFTGQGFQIPDEAIPILIFDENYINKLPQTAWVFDQDTPTAHVKGWSQGAYRTFGAGKVVVFGEAAMFTAQLAGPQKSKMGMNNPTAPENFQLLLNIIHWLDGKL
jgi:hypothetical protein